jgi:hypothetical protein
MIQIDKDTKITQAEKKQCESQSTWAIKHYLGSSKQVYNARNDNVVDVTFTLSQQLKKLK